MVRSKPTLQEGSDESSSKNESFYFNTFLMFLQTKSASWNFVGILKISPKG